MCCVYTNIISVSIFSSPMQCKDIAPNFDHDQVAKEVLSEAEAEVEIAAAAKAAAEADAAADDGDDKVEVVVEADEPQGDMPAKPEGDKPVQPKAKKRPATAELAAAAPPGKKQKPVPKQPKPVPKQPSSPPTAAAGESSDAQESTAGISSFMLDKLRSVFGCDEMSLLALRLLSESGAKGAASANSIVWNFMKRSDLKSPSAFLSGCCINARKALHLDHDDSSWDADKEWDSWQKSHGSWSSRGSKW